MEKRLCAFLGLVLAAGVSNAALGEENGPKNTADQNEPKFILRLASEPSSLITVGDKLLFYVEPGEEINISDLKIGPEGVSLEEFPKDTDDKNATKNNDLGEWVVLEPAPQELPNDGAYDKRLLKVVVPLKPGQVVVPKFKVIDKKTSSILGVSESFALDVKSGISPQDPKPEEPAPWAPLAGLGFPFWMLVLAGLVGLVLLIALLVLIIKLIKKKKAFIAPTVVMPEVPEDQAALSELLKLERAGHWKHGKHKIHYFGVSEIIKKYFSKRYEVDAVESTTYEVLLLLKKKSISDTMVNEVEKLFEKLDRVKFTDWLPAGDEEPIEIIKDAKALVNKTRKRTQSLVPGLENTSISPSVDINNRPKPSAEVAAK